VGAFALTFTIELVEGRGCALRVGIAEAFALFTEDQPPAVFD
jgi:hypothetical protein